MLLYYIIYIYRYSQTAAALPYRDQCLEFVHVEVFQRLQFIVAARRLFLGSVFALLRRTTHRATSCTRTMTISRYYAPTKIVARPSSRAVTAKTNYRYSDTKYVCIREHTIYYKGVRVVLQLYTRCYIKKAIYLCACIISL